MSRICLFLILNLVLSMSVFAQKNHSHGFIFQDVKEPRKNPFRQPKSKSQREELNFIYKRIPAFTEKDYETNAFISHIDSLVRSIERNDKVSNYGKSAAYYELFRYKAKFSSFDGKIYNYTKAMSVLRHGDLDTTVFNLLEIDSSNFYFHRRGYEWIKDTAVFLGALEIIGDYQQAMFYANKDEKHYLRISLLHYVESSKLFRFLDHVIKRKDWLYKDYYFLEPATCQLYLDSLDENKLTPLIRQILITVNEAYSESKYFGDQNLLSITPSLNYKYDENHWIGGEIALDLSSNRYLYRPYRNRGYARMSFFHFGVNFQLPSDGLREYYFGITRFSNLFGLYCKLVQFGFIRNIPNINKSAWFYKPQIGLSYGNFQIYYSYTHVFEKELRYVVPKHALNLRFSLPLYRIQQYSY